MNRSLRSITEMVDMVKHHVTGSLQPPAYFRLACLATSGLAPIMLGSGAAYAGPVGGVVAHGNANIAQSGNLTTITQGSDRAVIDWQSFNIGTAETARFVQPNGNSVAVNRVHDASASTIAGSLQANGHVVITNPNGVMFTGTAKVDVGGLTVSTATANDVDAAAFVSGARNDLPLTVAGNPNAKIINQGTITAKEAGLVGLVAPNVENSGIIRANKGKVILAGAEMATLDLYGDGLVSLAVTDSTVAKLAANSGLIQADGGTVLLTAQSAADVAQGVVRVEGTIQANSVDTSTGQILLKADGGAIQITGDVRANGDATKDAGSITATGQFVALGGNITVNGKNGGTINVHATNTLSLADRMEANGVSAKGGNITLKSDNVTWETSTSKISANGAVDGGAIRHTATHQIISSGHYAAQGAAGKGGMIDVTANSAKFLGASFNAKGQTHGGQVRLGGEYQGGKNLAAGVDELTNADYLVVDSGTSIDVSSTGVSGNGGTAILWSDITTLALAKINATPGTSSGNGGFVEISSAGELQYNATVQTGLGGRAGTVLLDPKNIIIASASFDPTAVIMGYGFTGGNNVGLDSLGKRQLFNSVSLSGNRLAAGIPLYDSADGTVAQAGAVFLFSFTDNTFSGGVLEGIMGKGYTGGKNVDVSRLEMGDQFGQSVSLDGNRLAVGAIGDDGVTNSMQNAGAIYLYDFSDNNFNGATLQGMIGQGYNGAKDVNLASQLNSNDLMGRGVSLNGNRIAVGVYSGDGALNARADSGEVHLISFTDSAFSGGALQGTIGVNYTGGKNVNLSGLEIGDQFGASLSLDGLNLAVGALADDGATNAVTNSGAVYLFKFNDLDFNGGTLVATVGQGYTGGKNYNVNLDNTSENFGIGIALNGNRLAISANNDDGFNNMQGDRGAVYLFTYDDADYTNLTMQGIIGYGYTGGNNFNTNSVGIGTANIGKGVALDGNRLVVAQGQDNGASINGGASNVGGTGIRMFTFNSNFTGMSLTATAGSNYSGAKDINLMSLTQGYATDDFGVSMSYYGNLLAIGARYDDGFNNSLGDSGAVYLFSFTNNNLDGGVLEGIMGYGYTGGKNYNMSQLQAGDAFGSGVSLNDRQLAVGAVGDDGLSNNRSNAGAVYLFSFTDDAFGGATIESVIGYGYTGGKNYNVSSLDAADQFGIAVSLDANRLAVGSHGDDGFTSRTDSGAVRLFTFSDSAYSGATLQSTIGYGYTGGKNYNVGTLDISDSFGVNLSLSGNRLAVAAMYDDGYGVGSTGANYGAAYLFSFSDSSFSNPTLEATIGYGYTGGKNIDTSGTISSGDVFARSVALDGTTLAVGVLSDDGVNDNQINSGAVYIYSFDDAVFNHGVLDATIGMGYTGGKNINNSSSNFSSYDQFGVSVSLYNGTLFVGANAADGQYNGQCVRCHIDSGVVFAYRGNAGTNVPAGSTFSNLSSGTLGLTPESIAALLSTPQDVILQASNDIFLYNALTVNNPVGNGGTLTLQAGRSILLNASITTDNGNLNLYANEKLSAGVVNSQRESGAAAITMAAGTSINAGTGTVNIRLDDGAGKINSTSGNITLNNINAGSMLIQSVFAYSNLILNGTLTTTNTGNALVLAPGASLINNAGAGALNALNGGRWLAYTDHASLNTLNGLTAQEQYNCAYGSCTVPVSGNALLYQYGANLLRIGVNATRQYGDTNPDDATLQSLFSITGFVNGDGWNDIDVKPTWSIAASASATAQAGTAHAITFSGGSDAYYSLYFDQSALNIAKKDITAIWNAPLTKTYGETNPVIGNGNFNFTGLVNGDFATVIKATGDFGAVTAATGAGTYNVGAIFDATNYNVTNNPLTTLTIGKKDITATWTGGLSKTYGDANPAVSSSNFTFSGLVNGDLGSAITSSANFGSITQGSNAGTYTNGVTGLFNAANYNVTNAPTTTLTINKRTLTPSLTGSVSKTYDGLTAAVLAAGNYNLANIYNGDDVSLASFASGTYGDKNAGSGKNVSVSGLTLTGTKASNYQLSTSSLTAAIGSIAKKALTITGISAQDKTYDGLLAAALGGTGSLVGVVGSENVTLNGAGATASFGDKNAGNAKAVTASGYALAGTDSGNYTLTQPTGLAANILQKALTVSGISVLDKTYDGLVAATLSGTGSLVGVVGSENVTLNSTGATASFGDKNVGLNKTVTVGGYALAGTDIGNYTLTQPTGFAATIVAKAITVALTGSVSKTYDGLTSAVLASGNFQLNGKIAGDNLSLSSIPAGSYDTKNAGSGKLVSVSGLAITGTDASNYTLSSTSASGTIGTIARANLIVSAASGLSKIYGDADPGFTYTYTGLVGGDGSASFTGALGRAVGQNAGAYGITQGTLQATGNYQIGTFNTANFTINKRALTAMVGDASRMYGDTNPLLNWTNATWSNLAYGETGAVLDAISFAMPTAGAGAAAGTTHAISINGFLDNNYTLSSSTNGLLNIAKANLLIQANDATSFSGQPLPFFTANYYGLKNGETGAVVQGLRFDTDAQIASVGSFRINPANGVASNYVISYQPGTLIMLPGTSLVPTSVQQGRLAQDINGQVANITWVSNVPAPNAPETRADYDASVRSAVVQPTTPSSSAHAGLVGIVTLDPKLQREIGELSSLQ